MDTQTIQILNYMTRPNMPLWAALVATCSLPEFFNPLVDRLEWRSFYQGRKDLEKAENFLNGSSRKDDKLVSADILTTLPLDIITNSTIQEEMIYKKAKAQ